MNAVVVPLSQVALRNLQNVKGYTYLTECALSSVELYDSHQWNENDGGKRHDPANGLSPPWVGMGALIRQWFIGHQAEDEYNLKKKQKEMNKIRISNSFVLQRKATILSGGLFIVNLIHHVYIQMFI